MMQRLAQIIFAYQGVEYNDKPQFIELRSMFIMDKPIIAIIGSPLDDNTKL